MRIGKQLQCWLGAALVVVGATTALVLAAERREDASAREQSLAQASAHQVSGLLTLTQEFARDGESRAADQWRARHEALTATLVMHQARSGADGAPLTELRAATAALPPLFERLQEIGDDRGDFAERRRAALVDQLLATTQAMSDFAFQWSIDAEAERARSAREFGAIALTVPLAMLGVLAGLAWLVYRRALLPLAALERGAIAVREGRLDHRVGNTRRDEIGELSRQFDAMTAALAADIAERKLAELARERSEKRLTELMNSIPAMVGWFDMDERCQYANDTGLKSLGLDRSQVPGITLCAALGDANYAQHAPYVREVLQGRRARLDGKIPFDSGTHYFQAHLIPDLGDSGPQRGFFMMTFDVTALHEAQQRQAQMEARVRAISDNLPVLIAYIDADQRYGFMNRTYKDWFGVEPDTVIGRTVAEVLGPALYEQRRAALLRALAGERVAFDMESDTLSSRRSLQSLYIPDIRADGAVAGVYALSTDVSAPKAVERELARLARSDTLTGLPNRLLFDELLPLVLARAQRTGTAVGLMFLDLDRFKPINDTHGHAGGDAVLREFANRLKGAVRVTDTVARLAGDEFVIALEGLHHAGEAEAIARNVLAQVRRPFRVLGLELAVTTSIGVAFHGTGVGPVTPAELLAQADEALYAAKLAGRDGFHLARQGQSVMGPLA